MSTQAQVTQQDATAALATRQSQPSPLYATFGEKFGIATSAVIQILGRAIIADATATQEEIAAAIVVCNQYGLNPFTKEIHIFKSKGKMLYVVGIDGWCKLINEKPQLNGIEFTENFASDGLVVSSITCKIHRTDRAIPTVVTEYMSECKRETEPWKKSPIRMLRHRSLIQCARVAFGFAGVMDEDDAETAAPGSYQKIIDQTSGATNAEDIEMRSLITKLGYNSARMQTLRQQYDGRPDALLEFLRAEEGKVGSRATVMQPARTQAKPRAQQQAKKPEPEPEQSFSDAETTQEIPEQEPGNGFNFEMGSLPSQNASEGDDVSDF